MKKTGLGRDPLSWIKPTSLREKREPERPGPRQGTAAAEKRVPKFRTFEARLTILLREDHLDFLDRMVREIRKNRSSEYRRERITKNTLIRVFIDAFRGTQLDTRNVPDEQVLLERAVAKIRK